MLTKPAREVWGAGWWRTSTCPKGNGAGTSRSPSPALHSVRPAGPGADSGAALSAPGSAAVAANTHPEMSAAQARILARALIEDPPQSRGRQRPAKRRRVPAAGMQRQAPPKPPGRINLSMDRKPPQGLKALATSRHRSSGPLVAPNFEHARAPSCAEKASGRRGSPSAPNRLLRNRVISGVPGEGGR